MRKSVLPLSVRTFAEEAPQGGDGGETTEDTSTEKEDSASESEEDEEDEVEGEEHLGDPGKKALDRMKARLKAEKAKNRELRDKYEPKVGSENDADRRFHQKILRSEIKAAAAGKFTDPADAYRFLDLEQFEVTDDGDVDEEEVAEAIAALLEAKPYLGVDSAQQSGHRQRGSLEGGVRKESAPAQLSRADLARMSPQAILAAEAKGQLKDLKAGKHN